MESVINTFLERQLGLLIKAHNSHFDAIALTPSASLAYFTGMKYESFERPILVLFIPDKPLIFILPELEAHRTHGLPYPITVITYNDDPNTWQKAFIQARMDGGLKPAAQIGIDPIHFRWLEMRYLEEAIPGIRLSSAQDLLASARLHKSESEITSIRKAVDIAQLALLATLPLINPGMTEKELASELIVQLYRHGSDPLLPFLPIVASGPNSANPHATPTERLLSPGDLLIIDWGASYNGYISDLTRTFSIGKAHPKSQQIGNIVALANQAGRHAAAPGVTAHEVDKATRSIISKAGYGEYFIHRTGHGIGLEGHEEPYIRSGNEVALDPGMVFTIEPGIYIPDEGGVRIEDNIVITATGAETLSSLHRELNIIGE
jgi:Xaa-Pro dipeptidase